MEQLPFAQWSVPRAAVKSIMDNFVMSTSTVVERFESNRGNTTKLLIELHDGHRVETVVMRHEKRSTVCVSSQVGCQMGCRFCATGTMGIIGDLTAFEILEQVIFAQQVSRLRNCVFMGMGEPLNNYDNVKKAIEVMIDPQRFGLSPRHVSVSTVGVVKNMHRMTDELPSVNLALSLHAPNQETRLRIVPAAAAHTIDKLMLAIDNHIARNVYGPRVNFTNKTSRKRAEVAVDAAAEPTAEDGVEAEAGAEAGAEAEAGTGKRSRALEKWTGVMIEYILIDGVNDTEAHAHELGALLSANSDRRAHVIVNLIPYNPTDVAEDYRPPTQASVERFANICSNEPYKLKTRVRKEMGQDIAGACGQLALVALNSDSSKSSSMRDVEDTVPSSSSGKRSQTVLRNGATTSRGGTSVGSDEGNNIASGTSHSNSSSTPSNDSKSGSGSNERFKSLVSWQVGVTVLALSAVVGMVLWGRKSGTRR